MSDGCVIDLRQKIESLTDLQRTALIVGAAPSSFEHLLCIGHLSVEQYWIAGCDSVPLYCPTCDTVHHLLSQDYDAALRKFLLELRR